MASVQEIWIRDIKLFVEQPTVRQPNTRKHF